MDDVRVIDRPAYRPPAPQPSSSSGLLRLLHSSLFNPLGLWTYEHFEALVVKVRTPLGLSLVVNDPALVKRVLLENADNYGRDTIQKRLLYRMTGRSLFLAEKEDWRIQRKALAPFFSAGALAQYLPAMAAAAEDAVAHLESLASDFDLGREMAALTVDVLACTLFSPGMGEPSAVIADGVRRYTDVNGPVELGDLLGLPTWLPGARRMAGWRATAQVKRRSRRLMAAARDAKYGADSNIIAAMLAARHPETGAALDARVIDGNVSTLIGAGSDTVAVALTWAIFLLSQTPEVLAMVENEVDVHVGKEGLTLEALGRLVWTRAVIEEAMRLYPPTPVIGRMAQGADRLGEEDIPAGTTILISPWVIHRHRSLWQDEELFVPERFLPGRREQIPRFAYLPFGAGPRICLGMGFAMQEAIALLATLLRHVRFERADLEPVRLCQRFTLQTEAPLRMCVRRRLA